MSGPYLDEAVFFQSARSGGGEVGGHDAALLVSLWEFVLGAALSDCSSGIAHSHFPLYILYLFLQPRELTETQRHQLG